MQIALHRSYGLLSFILISHMAAISLVIMSRLDNVLLLILLLLIVTSALHYCRHYGWLGRGLAVTAIRLEAGERCSLIDSNDQEQGGYRLSQCVLLGPLLILYLKPVGRGRVRSLVIPRDALDSQHWRQLQIRLRDPETWAK